MAAAGARPDQAIFLGDTEATDGEAARAAGMPFVLLARPTGAARAVRTPAEGASRSFSSEERNNTMTLFF